MKKILLLVCICGLSTLGLCTTFSKRNNSGQTLYYTTHGSGTVYVAPHGTYSAFTGTVSIPSTVYYDGTTYTVRQIGNGAFKNCTGVTEFVLPSSIEVIYPNAFYGCTGLTSINLPSSITKIQSDAFYGCTWLTSINLPDYLESLDGFANCTNLETVLIPNYVKYIRGDAFANCTSLRYVSMPRSLQYIMGNAFKNCSSLEYLEIPATVCKIEGSAFAGAGMTSFNIAANSTHYRVLNDGALVSYNGDTLIAYPPANNATSYNLTGSYHIIGTKAFYDNVNLQHLVLGDNVEQILASAFEGCLGLQDVSIGENMSKIFGRAFFNCIALNSLTIRTKTPPEIVSSSFQNVSRTCQIYVPCVSLNAYHSNSTFINFTNMDGLFDYDININVNDRTRGRVDILTEPSCEYPELLLEAIPYSGYKFVRWSDNCPDAMRSIDVEGDINLTAFFTAQTNGIDDIDDQDVLIYSADNRIKVTLSKPQNIVIFNIQGKVVFAGKEEFLSLPVSNGVYIVKINGIKPKTIVVS